MVTDTNHRHNMNKYPVTGQQATHPCNKAQPFQAHDSLYQIRINEAKDEEQQKQQPQPLPHPQPQPLLCKANCFQLNEINEEKRN